MATAMFSETLRKNEYTFTLMMATAVFAETLETFQHSMRLISEGRNYKLNSNSENLRTSSFITLSMPKSIITFVKSQV
jgi:hypothetical protein